MAWTHVCIAAALCACGGKAVIDGDLGAGGATTTTTTMSTGGAGGEPSTGGEDIPCDPLASFVNVVGDGPDQTYSAAGPDPAQTEPTGFFVYSGAGVSLEVSGCASNNSTNNCIDLSAAGIDGAGQRSGSTRIEYTSANGIVFVGDAQFLTLFDAQPVGGVLAGYFDGVVAASGGAESRFLSGDFSVCRLPDVIAD